MLPCLRGSLRALRISDAPQTNWAAASRAKCDLPVRILFESGDAYLVRTVDTGYLSLIRKDAILAIHISDSGTTACVES